MTPARWAEIRIVADRLLVSCNGGTDVIDDVYEMSQEECAVLDTMVLECHVCGHWFPTAEMTLAENGAEYECADCSG